MGVQNHSGSSATIYRASKAAVNNIMISISEEFKSKKIIVNYKELVIIDLNETDVNLIRSSQKILENSYSPYSGFKVGCSVLLSSGKVLCANNQENVAYPSGMCAERVALFLRIFKIS